LKNATAGMLLVNQSRPICEVPLTALGELNRHVTGAVRSQPQRTNNRHLPSPSRRSTLPRKFLSILRTQMAIEKPLPPKELNGGVEKTDGATDLGEKYEIPEPEPFISFNALKDRIRHHYELASDYYYSLWYVPRSIPSSPIN
jgi:hypothetical protein